MQDVRIEHVDVYTEDGRIKAGSIMVEDGKIKEILTEKDSFRVIQQGIPTIDGKGLRAIPGFIDTHIHGANGSDVMDGTANALSVIASVLPKEGTTRFLATTMTAEQLQIEDVLETIAAYEQGAEEARIEGIHVEGPFIAKERAGAQPTQAIIPPSTDLLADWQYCARGMIKTITLAPELDEGQACIKQAKALGINISAGHTNATYELMKNAVSKGLNQVTHLCNAMPVLHHRDVGVIGAVAMLNDLVAEIIVDGIHVTEEMIELLVRLIGVDRMMLITDGMRAKYMKSGTYDLGGQMVEVTEDGRALLADGTLAGSIVKMNEAARRMSTIPGVSWEDVIRMTSLNPAKQLGIEEQTGSISIGKDADIILVDEAFRVFLTICQGTVAYDRLNFN